MKSNLRRQLSREWILRRFWADFFAELLVWGFGIIAVAIVLIRTGITFFDGGIGTAIWGVSTSVIGLWAVGRVGSREFRSRVIKLRLQHEARCDIAESCGDAAAS